MSFHDYTPMRRVADTPSEFVRRYQALDPGENAAQNASRLSSLSSSYESARNAYLWRCGLPFCHPALQFPFLFFYLQNPHSESSPICHISPFLWENRYTSRLTKETFPAFLVNVCAIPYIPGNKVDQFYTALEALLRHAPKKRLRLIQEEIQLLSPSFTAWQQLQNALQISKEGNFFVSADDAQTLSANHVPQGAYLSLFQLQPETFLPAPLMRQYLEAYRLEAEEPLSYIPEPEAQPHTIIYHRAGAGGPALLSAAYRPDSHTFALRAQTAPLFNNKAMPLEHAPVSDRLPDGIQPLFHSLCSSSIQTLDRLAQLLAQAMDPAQSGALTVIYTKQHKQTLLPVLQQLFGCAAVASHQFTKHPKAEEDAPSFNQLTKAENLIQLFLGQIRGAGVVLISDLVPSEVSLPTVRKLLGGKELSLSTPSCPPQRFCSNLHFLCVTDRLDRAQLLEKKLKAELVDLSCVELPVPLPQSLSPEAVHWLRTAFLLHGLKQNTLNHGSGTNSVPGTQVPAPASLQDELQAFLADGCRQGADLCCDTARLYQGFLQFHLQRHPGTQPPISKICFNKEIRDLIAHESTHAIAYKKLRPGPKEPPRWYYVGLDLAPAPAEPSGPISPPQSDLSDGDLKQYLLDIHKNRLPL